MSDLKSKQLIVLKGLLFLCIIAGAAATILLEQPTLKVAALLALLVWASARFYYFLFYVLEKHVDPSFRYAGVFALLSALASGRALATQDPGRPGAAGGHWSDSIRSLARRMKAARDRGAANLAKAPGRPSIIVVTLFVASVLSFGASLTQDGFYLQDRHNPNAWSPSIFLLLFGWLAVFKGFFAWLANPALLFVWSLIWFRPTRIWAVVAGAFALLFALSFLCHQRIITGQGPSYATIAGYGLGYRLWVGSIAAALASSVVALWKSLSPSPRV